MNTDIRISIEFWDHPKTGKMERRLGLQGVKSLQILWFWAAKNAPDGDLSAYDEEDIEISARWPGESGSFFRALVELKWVDIIGDEKHLHEWALHNPWAAGAGERADKARFSKLAHTKPKVYESLKAQGVDSISREDYERIVNEPTTNRQRTVNDSTNDSITNQQRLDNDSPSPSPSPSPIPKTKEKHMCVSSEAKSETTEYDNRLLEAFQKFWEIYPRKINKKAAEKAWMALFRAAPKSTHADLMRGVALHIDDYKEDLEERGTEERFIKHPATWLRAVDFSEPPVRGAV